MSDFESIVDFKEQSHNGFYIVGLFEFVYPVTVIDVHLEMNER